MKVKGIHKSLSLLFNKKYRILFHALFWLVIYLDEFLSFFGVTEAMDVPFLFFLSLLIDMFLVYFCIYILVPKLLLKGKLVQFFGLLISLVLMNVYVTNFLVFRDYTVDEYFSTAFAAGTVATLTVVGSALAIKMFKYFLEENERRRQLDKATLEAELVNLRDQMNPHFLFNALNGIYIQSKKRPEEVPESITLLSDLLRYQLYDCNQENVPLTKEIDYINNFIALEKMRRSDVVVSFDVEGDTSHAEIAPFMLQPFVENAFKHSQGTEKEAIIEISLILIDSELLLEVTNTKPVERMQHLDGGIGLPNVKRRLELLYYNKYELLIDDTRSRYETQLKLNLS